MHPIILEAAAVGPLVTLFIQFLKAMPFAKKILGEEEKVQKARLQAIVFGLTVIATVYTTYNNELFHVEHIADIVAYASLVLGSSYTTYQALIKKTSNYLPEGTFKV